LVEPAGSHDEWTLTARWLFPVSSPPLARGCITVAGDRIAGVWPHGHRAPDVDLGDVAVLPGLVNAHTHLDLSGMRGLAPPTPDFTGWLRQVIAHRRARSPEQVREDVQAGLAESLRHGTTVLGDISGDGGSWEALMPAPVRAVVFREMLGLPSERTLRVVGEAFQWARTVPESTTCRPGLSPHAPYSVNASIIRSVAWNGYTMALHLAESPGEIELLAHHAGPFVPFLQELGVWEPGNLAPSVDWALQKTRRAASVLFIHGNYLAPNAPVRRNGTIVYCPRTHAAFGHPPHPFRHFLARGVRVALGTDGLASNPDLSILAEARFLHDRYPDVHGDGVFRLLTLSGAEALGWQDEAGSLEPGKSADLVVIPLPPEDHTDPHLLVLESDRPVQRVLWRGRWRSSPLAPASGERVGG
jgi:cytosine/adenosine deaminase-related metal-dependent hydrolase